jgi:zinc protease
MVTLIVKAGQINEPEDKAGLANLVAELLTEGTKNRTSKELSADIDFIGASLDAAAGSDYISISLSVLKKDIQKGLELFADVLLNPLFAQNEIERTRDRIKGMLKQREEEPSFLAERALKKEVFGRHPYGRLVEGFPDTMDKIKREDLIQFHSDYFLPNNAILSVSGDMAADELEAVLKKYLGEWKRKDVPFMKIQKVDADPIPVSSIGQDMRNPSRTIPRIVKIEKDLTQANILIGGSGIPRHHPDYYAVSVMNYIFGGGGFVSRLMKSIRDEMGLAYDVSSSFIPYREGGILQIGVQTKNESANVTVEEILHQIDKLCSGPVSAEELSDAKAYLTGSFPRRLDTNRKIADFLATVEFYDLGIDYDKKYPDYINAVTKEDVLRVARKYLAAERFVLVLVANQQKATLKE